MVSNDISHPPDRPAWASLGLRWGRRLFVAAAILLALFLLLELLAFLLLPRRSTRFLIEGRSNDQPAWIDNQFFSYRFFSDRMALPPLPVVALQTPSPEAIRVCLLGGSSAMGAPDPAFGIGRQLQHMLQSRYPGHPVEIIQMTLEGGNSHVLREAVRDLDRLRPDAVVVLTGNEEIAGPYGPASGLGRWYYHPLLNAALRLFSRSRQSQLFIAGINRLFPARVDLDVWQSQEPMTLRGRMAPDDPRLSPALRTFRRNLKAILHTAARASPVVVVCTVPVNLRDCAPFATSFLEDESTGQQVRETLRAAIAAESATNRIEAARLYSEAIRLHPTHAEALFRAARMALRENRTAEAAALFSRARDADALRLRADSRINAIIRQCAAETSASLFDAEALMAIRSPQGIPGREWFLDHVHFTFEANHLLASSLLDRLEFLQAFRPRPEGSVPGPDVLAGELLFHPWGRAAQVNALIARQIRAPFRRQINHAEILDALNQDKREWDSRVAAISPENTRRIIARRRALFPDDPWLAAGAVPGLVEAGDFSQASTAAHAAHRHWPHRFEIRGLLALVGSCQGQDVPSGVALIRGPDGSDFGYFDVEQAIAIGRSPLKNQGPAAIRPWFEYALERDPMNSEAAIELANTLYHLDEGAQALELLQNAIERNPRNPLLWEEVAKLYCLAGKWELATRCFQQSEEIAPYRYERLLKWADALARLHQYSRARKPIDRYLAAIPDDPEALALHERILANLPAKPEPIPEPEEKHSSRRYPWE